MSLWTGVSHARMTRSMHALPGGAYKVLAAVRRLIPDGQRRKVSQADIARRAGVSEGTVSSAMRALDGAYLRRHPLGRGRGRGYEIEVLPPPERRPLDPLGAPPKGSEFDPCNRSFVDGVPTPQSPPQEGSESDPSIFSLHAHEQQQQPTASEPADPAAEPPAQLSAETISALVDAGAHPKLIQRVATYNPGCTAAEVKAALAAAGEKPSAHTPPGLALECLATRQQVVAPRQRPAPRPRREPHHDARQTDWAALQRDEDARTGAPDLTDLPDPAPLSAEALMAQAYTLLGSPPGPADEAFLAERLAEVADPDAAVRALWQRRAALLAQDRARQDAQIDAIARAVGGRITAPERDIARRRIADGDTQDAIAEAISARRARRSRGGI